MLVIRMRGWGRGITAIIRYVVWRDSALVIDRTADGDALATDRRALRILQRLYVEADIAVAVDNAVISDITASPVERTA